ncbi:hypothetical protein ACFL3S_05515 [Gemmatimonadota bacterium]
MHRFEIQSGAHRGRKVSVPYYLKGNHGVEIKLAHNVPARPGTQLRWVQTVYENGEIARRCGASSYVDPLKPTGRKRPGSGHEICKADDEKPFYYTDKAVKGQHRQFYDAPQERAPKQGRLWVRFCTSLTEVRGKRVELLLTVYWGFDRYVGGRIAQVPARLASPKEVEKHLSVLRKWFPDYTYV